MQSEILYSIALRACPKIGDLIFSKLIQHFGDAKSVWESSKKDLEYVFGIGNATTKHIGDEAILDFAHKEMYFCEKNRIEILLEKSKNYPEGLKNIPDLPSVLYKKGTINYDSFFLSIVGTRNNTAYGKAFLKELFELLKNQNVCIVSGLATGTDTTAHQLALEYNLPTIGVLAHGLHTLYPAANKKLAQDILEHEGALLSEFNSSQQGVRQNFIQRNRVIAGISPITIVVESAFGGGSMSTANFASQYNREVFALPGRIDDKYSQGCNLLISQQKANILYHPQNLLQFFDKKPEPNLFSSFSEEKTVQTSEKPKPKEHINVYEIILENPLINLDDLCHLLETPSYQLLPILLNLELEGFICTNSSKQYQASK